MRLGATTGLAVCLMTISAAALAFDLQGHRGARGLAPENTLPAFSAALAIGVTTLELDVGMTKDGVLVVHHDRWLSPNTARGPDGEYVSGRGPLIRSLTLAEIKRYDVGRIKPGSRYAETFPHQKPHDGTRIPTLTEVFDLVRQRGAERVRFNIETKVSPTAPADTVDPETMTDALARAVREARLAQRVSVQSFDWRTLKIMQRIAPEIERVCLTSQSGGYDTIQAGRPGASPWTAGLDVDDFAGSVPRLVAAAECAVWSPPFADVTSAALAEAKKLGLKTIPWTVDRRENMERMIDMGVDGLISDYPDLAREVMAAKNLPLPPRVPEK